MALPRVAVFADAPDPRRDTKNKLHGLSDLLVIATCAVLGGADSWDSIEEYGRTKEGFFKRFLPLANGIPSADTFGRVFAKLDPEGVRGGGGGRSGAGLDRQEVGAGVEEGDGDRVPAPGECVGE